MDGEMTLLQAVELILATPDEIRNQVEVLEQRYYDRYQGVKDSEKIKDLLTQYLICFYTEAAVSWPTNMINSLIYLTSVMDEAFVAAAVSMKYRIELIMAISVVYGRDISLQEEKWRCFIIGGLEVTTQTVNIGGKISSKAFSRIVRHQLLKGVEPIAAEEIFNKVGTLFTRQAVSLNKTLWSTGNKARDFYKMISS